MLVCARTDTLTKAIIYACVPSQQSPFDLKEKKRAKDVLFPLNLFMGGLFW